MFNQRKPAEQQFNVLDFNLTHYPPRLLACPRPQWNNPAMIIGDRLRALREEKNLSQGDIEKRTGLVRPYISRIEIIILFRR